MSMKRPTHRTMTDSQLEDWNECYPVGSPCILILDDRSELPTRTKSMAWRLGHGAVVVAVEGKSGGWDIDRVRMLETHKP